MARLIESSSAQLRLDAARTFVREHSARGDVWIVAASRGAADDLARALAAGAGATIGLHRFSLGQLALHLAGAVLAADDRAPATYLGSEAVAARATFDALRDGGLSYFAPVANTPGFPRALARTIQELRFASAKAAALGRLPLGGRDLAALLERFDEQFDAARAIDRAALFDAATRALQRPAGSFQLPASGSPLPAPGFQLAADGLQLPALLLLDVPIDSEVELALVRALLARASDAALLTVPFGDVATLDRLKTVGLEPDVLEQKDGSDLAALRRYLFADRVPPEREAGGDVVFYSAPGEGRECVEIARRVLQEARRGVRFDEMAVFLRAPDRYVGLLEHAFRRAGVRAWFDRGTRRPHPAGRAFVAVLACAVEKLSARRFAEYLSLAQVPTREAAQREPAFVTPLDDDDLASPASVDAWIEEERAPGDDEAADLERRTPELAEDDPLIEGSLRAPWKWERLIVESAVIGGDPRRWHRRLTGYRNELRLQLESERREDPDSPRVARIERDLRNLDHLRAFALPVIDRLAGWPAAATWGEWLDRFVALTPMVLSQPERVQAVLEQLRPMAAIGPVSLAEARDVVAERLRMLEVDPPRTRYGRVFVGGPQQARGRTFRVVFVPGLAERLFPQHPHEDPLLLDAEMRAPLRAGDGTDLVEQKARLQTERLLLRLAIGAPAERLWLSYPRLDTAEARPRVPSFYALDVMRAVTGRIPPHGSLQARAAAEGRALLAWPAPALAADAIDDLEHDLAVLKALIEVEPAASVRGHAHYLLRLNECLKRSVSARWARGRSQWTPYDGLTRVTGVTRPILDRKRLAARPYSLSALQKYAACPYQFLLSAIHRLERPRDIEPLQKIDPLTRGSIFHEAQAVFFRRLKQEARLPLTADGVAHALATVDAALAAVAARYQDELAPAIERVWDDEIADIGRDLRVWVRRLPLNDGWTPAYFEFAFGLPGDRGRDPASVPDPVLVGGRFLLRGSVDLIETQGDDLRITDHKTGRNRTTWKTVIGGGAILQPVLYGLAVEGALGRTVKAGRLFYCTSAGGFTDHPIPLSEQNRRAGLEALEIVDRAVELGFLPAAPDERACTWCDFLPVCGPDEHARVAHKAADKLGDLHALRGRP
jgi:ATP-dependent helicase/nuclease subunit B